MGHRLYAKEKLKSIFRVLGNSGRGLPPSHDNRARRVLRNIEY